MQHVCFQCDNKTVIILEKKLLRIEIFFNCAHTRL